jgi:hypothetical protein
MQVSQLPTLPVRTCEHNLEGSRGRLVSEVIRAFPSKSVRSFNAEKVATSQSEVATSMSVSIITSRGLSLTLSMILVHEQCGTAQVLYHRSK